MGGCATVRSPTLKAFGEISTLEQADILPPNIYVQGSTCQKPLDNLLVWAARRRIPVRFVDQITLNGEELMGYSKFGPQGWFVLIDNTLPVDTKFITLIHELAHLYHAANLSKEAGEVFAEMVAYQVAQNVGLHSRPQNALYLAMHSPLKFQQDAVFSFNAEIDAVVSMLTQAAKGSN
jgi:hypothetical protein